MVTKVSIITRLICLTQEGFTSLHLVSNAGHKEVVELLLERDASKDKADEVLYSQKFNNKFKNIGGF